MVGGGWSCKKFWETLSEILQLSVAVIWLSFKGMSTSRQEFGGEVRVNLWWLIYAPGREMLTEFSYFWPYKLVCKKCLTLKLHLVSDFYSQGRNNILTYIGGWVGRVNFHSKASANPFIDLEYLLAGHFSTLLSLPVYVTDL